MINEIDSEIRYIKGKENRVADSLNIWVHVHHLVFRSSYGLDLQDMILQEGQRDVRYMEIVHKLQQGDSTDPDGQAKRVNMILENMLRMYVMHQQCKWEEYLPLVEFSYNNDYQESLRMSRFEGSYGRSCNTPISWSDLISKLLIGPDMLADMEQEM
eukprot:PITA_23374